MADPFSDAAVVDIERITTQALKEVFEDNYQVYPEGLQTVTERVFNEAVDSGFGKPEGVMDELLINQVKMQNSVFAAMKAKGLTIKLEQIKSAEKCKSFREYLSKAMPTASKFQRNYIQAEYTTLKRSMQSSRKFSRALRDTDLYPFIRYMPSRAEDPRESHKIYYGVTRPATDSFWNSHLPPLDWNCDCWWKTVKTGETPIPKDLPDLPAGLDNNPAVSGQPFSVSHPYFSSLDNKTRREVLKRTAAGMAKRSVDDITVFKADLKGNGCYFSFGNAKQVNRELALANQNTTDVLTAKGRFVELLDVSNKPGVKSYDAYINQVIGDFKEVSSSTAVDNGLRDANKKGRNLNIKGDVYLYCKNDFKGLLKALISRLNRSKNINNVFVVKDRKVYLFDKNTKGLTEVNP